MYTKEQLMKHMENGGQIYRTTTKDRFFYKIENDELLCRCNELGGWHLAIGGIRWERDKLEIATIDWDYREPKTIEIKLPTIEETIGAQKEAK